MGEDSKGDFKHRSETNRAKKNDSGAFPFSKRPARKNLRAKKMDAEKESQLWQRRFLTVE
jgi:hypothetical protein